MIKVEKFKSGKTQSSLSCPSSFQPTYLPGQSVLRGGQSSPPSSKFSLHAFQPPLAHQDEGQPLGMNDQTVSGHISFRASGLQKEMERIKVSISFRRRGEMRGRILQCLPGCATGPLISRFVVFLASGRTGGEVCGRSTLATSAIIALGSVLLDGRHELTPKERCGGAGSGDDSNSPYCIITSMVASCEMRRA